ncbi:uncharacterized protein [Diadema antillarum]|uniref:uncharacterized protein n=1 Tax=Diadema antillarum TaxID=105358 RepID=UPI003A8582F4
MRAPILKRLDSDRNLPDRTKLSPTEIYDLLGMCLNFTLFRWRETFYQLTKRAAKGSPLSPIVGNLIMEDFEKTTLQTATLRPMVWLRYVGDTFVVWQHGAEEIINFLQHLNSQRPSIKFTMEMENQGAIPFLDTKITRMAQGSLSHQIYRKPTYRSYHHPSVLRSINKTLVNQVHQVSNQAHLPGELKHIKQVLKHNSYPHHNCFHRVPICAERYCYSKEIESDPLIHGSGAASHKIQLILREADI